MTPNNDRIYGKYYSTYWGKSFNYHIEKMPYNPKVQPGFDQIDNNNRPDYRFHNYRIYDNKNNVLTGDHQGHIVPQNMINPFLKFISNYIFKNLTINKDENIPHRVCVLANQYMDVQYQIPDAGFYNEFFMKTIDIDKVIYDTRQRANDPNYVDTCFDDFFSLVTWNPLNICRAPEDKYRKGMPGNHIDYKVLCLFKRILERPSEIIKNTEYIKNKIPLALSELFIEYTGYCRDYPPSLNNIQLAKFITTLNQEIVTALLSGINPIGYYSFLWINKNQAGKEKNYQPYTSH